jgi:hypothetical protein
MTAPADAPKLFELRLYQPYAGRMPDLLRRFREQIPALFARHGLELCATWLAEVETPRLVYLTQHAGPAERDKAWAAFGADPQWQAVRSDSNAGTEMLQGYELHFLKPRPGLDLPAQPASQVRELVFLPTRHGQETEVTAWMRSTLMPQLRAADALLAHCFDVTSGIGLPQSVMLIAWSGEPTALQREEVRLIRLPVALSPLERGLVGLRHIALEPA